VISDNPVRRLSAERLWNRIERRTRYVEPEQLPAWWQAVQSLEDKPQYPSREVHRDYLVLLLLTGLRRTEALCLRWENVNLKVGTLCAVDSKNRSDHVLPMERFCGTDAASPAHIGQRLGLRQSAHGQPNNRSASSGGQRCGEEWRALVAT
jgi:Site-specific recombinase XerD